MKFVFFHSNFENFSVQIDFSRIFLHLKKEKKNSNSKSYKKKPLNFYRNTIKIKWLANDLGYFLYAEWWFLWGWSRLEFECNKIDRNRNKKSVEHGFEMPCIDAEKRWTVFRFKYHSVNKIKLLCRFIWLW